MRFSALAVLATLAACGAPPSRGDLGFSSGTTICPVSAAPLQGVDVSHYEGAIDWPTAADAGIAFGIAKATEGLTLQDDQFANNWAGMQQSGVARGAYHFFHPGDDGTQQADFFLATVTAQGTLGEIPPALDWETADSSTSAAAIVEAQKFIDEIKLQTGLTTLIYTYPDFWNQLGNPSQFGAYPVWFANYQTQCPSIPPPWNAWFLWQYASTGTVPGILPSSPGMCDLDEFDGTLAQLEALGSDGGSPPGLDAGPPNDAGNNLISQVSGNEALTVVNWQDQHMEIFGVSPAGSALHSASAVTGDTWSAAATLDTGAQCGSGAAFWGGIWEYPELFSPLTNGATGHLWWTSGVGWNTYQPYGGSDLAHVSTLTWTDGHEEIFALGGDGALWHDFWDETQSAWAGWSSLGGSFATGAGPIMRPDGVGELYLTDASGVLWHATSAGPNTWNPWVAVASGFTSRPSPVRWPDGHVSVFARGGDGFLYTLDPSVSAEPLLIDRAQAIVGDPSALLLPGAGSAPAGPLVVARTAAGGVVWLSWTGTAFTAFASLGQQAVGSDPFGWLRADGQAEAFAVDPSGTLVHSLRDRNAGWQSWATVDTGFEPCVAPVIHAGPAVDGGFFDAGVVPDAGVEADGGIHLTPDGGSCVVNCDHPAPSTGCSCSGGSGGAAGAWWVGLGLLCARRLRRKSTQG